MNAYDFDNTIYDGESIFDFFKFYLSKDLSLIKYFPKILFMLIQYKLTVLSIDDIYNTVEKIVDEILKKENFNLDELVKEFWNKNYNKLKPEFLKMLKSDDLIITGCPNFLIDYIQKDLKVENIICTEFDLETKKLKTVCLGKNKVKLYNDRFKDKKINKFYTDSLNDIPFMKLSCEVYLVKNKKIKFVDKEKYIK